MFGGLEQLTFPHDHEIKSAVSDCLISDQCLFVQTFIGLMFEASVPTAAVELKFGSTGHPIDRSVCDPTLDTVTALDVVDVDAALLNFLLKPTSGDFVRV